MKTLTALLLASGMAVTMIPATTVVAQENAGSMVLETQLDGATLDQIAAATTAVAVYVNQDFDLAMAPANIADVRAALDANDAISLFLDSREIDTPDVVGVAVNGETNLMIFVAQDPSDDDSLVGTMTEDGMVSVEGDVDGTMDDEDADVDADVDADADVDTDTDVSVDGDDVDADVNAEGDADADADVNADDDGVTVDGEVDADASADGTVTTN